MRFISKIVPAAVVTACALMLAASAPIPKRL